jgi:hypothetical protein
VPLRIVITGFQSKISQTAGIVVSDLFIDLYRNPGLGTAILDVIKERRASLLKPFHISDQRKEAIIFAEHLQFGSMILEIIGEVVMQEGFADQNVFLIIPYHSRSEFAIGADTPNSFSHWLAELLDTLTLYLLLVSLADSSSVLPRL